MPRKSKNKYMKYTSKNLEDAVNAVKEGVYSYRKASQIFNIPKTTIMDHVSGRIAMGSKPGRKAVIPEEKENRIAQKIADAADKGFGVTKRQLTLKVSRLCKSQNIQTPFKKGIPGEDWWRGFQGRHPEIVLRKPEKLSTSRSRMLNRVVVKKYFDDLGKIITVNNLPPAQIWNMDETGKQFEHKPTNVCARKGTKSLPGRTSNSRENITILACVNGNADKMPPMCVVKGKTAKSVHSFCTMDAPKGTIWTFQERAWMCDMLGELWFSDVFLKHCGPARPQLLILDSHGSHEVLGLLEKARSENIIILALPPHTTHVLQPLDRSIFGPFTKSYDRSCTEFLSEHPDHNISKQTWPRIFKSAWETAFTSENIKAGFRATGIIPFNPNVIPDSVPSDAFDQPLSHTVTSPQTELTVTDIQSSESEFPASSVSKIVSNLDPFLPLNDSDITTTEMSTDDSETTVQSDQVPYLLMALGSGEFETEMLSDFSIEAAETANVFESVVENVSTSSSDTWNMELESIFNVPMATPKSTKPNRSTLTSHRLLTDDDIIMEKQEKIALKQRLEKEKEHRKQVRLQKQSKKTTPKCEKSVDKPSI